MSSRDGGGRDGGVAAAAAAAAPGREPARGPALPGRLEHEDRSAEQRGDLDQEPRKHGHFRPRFSKQARWPSGRNFPSSIIVDHHLKGFVDNPFGVKGLVRRGLQQDKA